MSEHLGLKIKRLREDKNMSMEQLADISGITVDQLSLIEAAELVPPMSVLIRLARALEIRLGTILDGQEHDGPVVSGIRNAQLAVAMSGENTTRTHLAYHSLAQDKTDRNMDPVIIEVGYAEPGTSLSHHEGEEFLYVLEEAVELRYGSETYALKAGESIYYDSLVPHCLSTPDSDVPHAKVLAVTYTPY